MMSENSLKLVSTLCGKATTLINVGRKEEALVPCEEALKIDPNSALAWANKGAALDNLGRNEEAISGFG